MLSSVHSCTSPARWMRAVDLGGAEHELGEGEVEEGGDLLAVPVRTNLDQFISLLKNLHHDDPTRNDDDRRSREPHELLKATHRLAISVAQAPHCPKILRRNSSGIRAMAPVE
jgi:hypothetical protein